MGTFSIGDQVIRRGQPRKVGTVIAILPASTVWRATPERARVRWPAPYRIGGESHHSTVATKTLVPAGGPAGAREN